MSLCRVCEALDLEEHESHLDKYERMLAKAEKGCGGCRFFVTILQENYRQGSNKLYGKIVFLSNLRLDCRSPSALSRRQWSVDGLLLDICKPEGYLGKLSTTRKGPEAADLQHVGNESPEIDCKHIIPLGSKSEECFSLICSWMKECSEHGCRPQVDVRLPKRVIEISSDPSVPPRLFTTNNAVGRYVTLSHCWGNIDTVRLTKETISEMHSSINFESLPRTFRDAIVISRNLGLSYLWIDALCIMQDDVTDWATESPKMATVYGQASLAISATMVEGNSSGIFSERDIHYSPPLCRNKNR
jgi:hypothetical protein